MKNNFFSSNIINVVYIGLMVTLRAIDINERYKILKVDLSEENADVFL